MGLLEKRRGDPAQALPWYQRAVTADPNNPGFLTNLATTQVELGQAEIALPHLRRVIELQPRSVEGYNNLAFGLHQLGRFAEEAEACRAGLALDPGQVELHVNLAGALLGQGDYAQGLEEWRWRWKRPVMARHKRPFSAPEWQGGEMAGKKLLVCGEQGIGDELVYFTLLPELVRRGAHLTVECDPRLVGLLSRRFPEIAVVACQDPPLVGGGFDAQVACGDLPAALGDWPSGATKPSAILSPDVDRAKACRAWLDGLGPGLKVGVSWRSKTHYMGRMKSLPLERWEPVLSVPGVVFVNLQYGDTKDESRRIPQLHTHPDIDRLTDMEGLCALISELDLVVSTSNVTPHLAGALGKACWLLLGGMAYWYWGAGGEDTPFYSSVRAVRACVGGDWEDLLTRIGQDLAERSKGARTHGR
ncbi:MAG: hypothetical protein A2516_09915 [Alphaproteobacteria bacterium RIFOXYD12_FULL_60_8]|nr:MAG: hypothetical protein A2516_09915 [Alphaproteobacteria bacterium RIFOXYD12_FULL_60_8]